ncbi:anhydro-N-acetylmuramic acid kinase AnmK [Sporolactobacillus laevolacticus]|uniref:anhydro-N-acetylmuramic acid kinase AnmK n=1 Tax=Sporolactobacillus laevolacticus TaxID=33018 RepID=UPI0025B611FE|nr:anhydro-N-acetylmuramic acid kinase AnmK [Sporolactobacillus laevolacticus]MDN3955766.1 anhydro-N-acetylmuramic acid kinase AnmK [Sporolactobacillus laevolacticus]
MVDKYVVGLMSGTSADGIDAVLTRIKDSGDQTELEVLDFETIPYTQEMQKKIFTAMDPDRSSSPLICSLNFELGYCFADAVKSLCHHAHFSIDRVDLIGSHGQTIYHIPDSDETYLASTLQIGEPAVISYETRTPVASNFRVMDMAAGGQGAPLIPYVDYLLFRNLERTIALLNIGGISNITVLPKRGTLRSVQAFDMGPGNMIIDELVRKFYGRPYDRNGNFAKRGKVIKQILKTLMNDSYFVKKPPKSTGRERYGKQYAEWMVENWRDQNSDDLIATATCFTAKAIFKNYQDFIQSKNPVDEIWVSGGGSHNPVLIGWLQTMLPDVTIKTFESNRLNADAKEAAAFAVLANEMVHQQPANVPTATGAKEQLILGNYTPFTGMKNRILIGG